MPDNKAREWNGSPPSPGEHRTTGSRAWCSDCHEWCYPDLLCRCCSVHPPLDTVLVKRWKLRLWANCIEDEIGLDMVVQQMRDVAKGDEE